MGGRVARYDEIGRTYTATRREDPRIAAAIHDALGDTRTVVNVGAGAGAYEPADRDVVAVEPSDTMIEQRPPGAGPAAAWHARHGDDLLGRQELYVGYRLVVAG